ncbi:MAG: hypothetical protein HXX08_11580 [Chloroflexi bacterium]|uniref:Uncharacterized protein n=1 Tax=Candidatus Chlorohelix allophototropha TaxID=3003348 RepID=A0A8T7M2U7_9CHLR|nr:hypothetical protein [Chloroflexota bacterium]WJW65880.1 hypothetical protein OZ401_001659 [Chloroflexota bacterium L227-S17]
MIEPLVDFLRPLPEWIPKVGDLIVTDLPFSGRCGGRILKIEGIYARIGFIDGDVAGMWIPVELDKLLPAI